MLESLALGVRSVCTPVGLLITLLGTVVGIIFGAVPGLSATTAIVLCLPLTYKMSSINGMALLISLFIGGISGGLVSAILTRIPGTPSSVATTWDGYPMTQKGQGVKALGIGICASFFGTLFSIIVLIFAAPSLARVAIQFGAYEYFAVAVFSITMMATLSEKSMSKGLISGLMGCIFATVGMDPAGSQKRFTLGIRSMMSGFNILPVLVGLFAVCEIITYIEKARNAKGFEVIDVDLKGVKGTGFTWKEFWGQKWNLLRSAVIGCIIGILPGIGASTSNVMAYTVAKKSSKHPEAFGTGIIDGIVASEAANNASIGGAMVPLLALGIPGDSVTALLLGGLTLKGISAGPLLFTEHVDLVYSIFIAMILASVFMLVIEFYGLRIFAKLLGLPKYYMLPAIFLFCVIGAYGVHNNIFDVWTVLVFGALGFVFSKLDIPASPFILGFIIGPLAEENLRRGLMLSKGSFLPFLQSPLALVFFGLALISVVASTVSHRKRIKAQKQSNG